MNPADRTPEYIDDSATSTTTRNRLKRYVLKYRLATHAATFFMAVVLTLVLAGVCVYIITDGYNNKEDTGGYMLWAQGTLALLIGVWITDRPKIGKKERQPTTTQHYASEQILPL